MKNRFPCETRTGWRQRFLAIARELEGVGAPRRQPLDAAPGFRAGLASARMLRGIRLGCARAS